MDINKYLPALIVGAFLLFFIRRCSKSDSSSTASSEEFNYVKEPINDLIKENAQYSDYSIELFDMDYDEPADEYKHQYRTLYEPGDGRDTLLEKTTDWLKVSDVYFQENVDNMGMHIVTKVDGKLTKVASPAGYSKYVGNDKYGQWEKKSDGTSFWSFYGKYMFMSSMFRMAMYPVMYRHYSPYMAGGYYGRSAYYGSGANGGRVYGTGSSSARTNSSWGSKPSSFKQNVRSKVSQSASATKKSRSSSRTGSTSRSRSGGSGK